jgi:hypothetical protein
MILFLFAINSINFLYYFNYTYKNSTFILNGTNITKLEISDVKCTANVVIDLIGDVSSSLYKTFFPGVLMTILSLLLIRKVREAKKSLNKGKEKDKGASIRERQLAIAVLCMNAVFFILNLPLLTMAAIKQIYASSVQPKDQDKLTKAILANLYLFTYDISNLYYSLMFLQFLVFNKIFKKELFVIVGLAQGDNFKDGRTRNIEH